MSTRPVSILVDPKLDIADVRLALKHSSLEIVGVDAHPNIFVCKPIEADAQRAERTPS